MEGRREGGREGERERGRESAKERGREQRFGVSGPSQLLGFRIVLVAREVSTLSGCQHGFCSTNHMEPGGSFASAEDGGEAKVFHYGGPLGVSSGLSALMVKGHGLEMISARIRGPSTAPQGYEDNVPTFWLLLVGCRIHGFVCLQR